MFKADLHINVQERDGDASWDRLDIPMQAQAKAQVEDEAIRLADDEAEGDEFGDYSWDIRVTVKTDDGEEISEIDVSKNFGMVSVDVWDREETI